MRFCVALTPEITSPPVYHLSYHYSPHYIAWHIVRDVTPHYE